MFPRGLTDKLYQAMKLGVPDRLTLSRKLKLEVAIFEAEKSLDKVIAELKERGFLIAATYVENAKENLFTFLRYWIQTGEVAPKVTSQDREAHARTRQACEENWIQLERERSCADHSDLTQNHRRKKSLGERMEEKLCLKNAVNLSLTSVYLLA